MNGQHGAGGECYTTEAPVHRRVTDVWEYILAPR